MKKEVNNINNINTMKEKRDYMKPAMKVVELRHRTMLLTDSGGDRRTTLQNYGWHDEDEE
jgi:hypothetical protein